jgi:transposase
MLCAWLVCQQAPGTFPHVILEPTSTYHQRLVQHLVRSRLLFTLVNPARTAGYAKVRGSRAKTDPADARLLARYGERETPAPSPEPDKGQERLRSLRRHYDWLQREIGSARNRLEAARHSPWTPASVRRSLERVLRDLEQEAERVATELQAIVAHHERWRWGIHLLMTVPGVGWHTALLLLAELPPVHRCTHGKQWVAACGVDPQPYESGTTRRAHLSRMGSPRIRAKLYLAAVSALRWNPAIAALGERLKAKGKRGPVRVMAAMNKLLRQCFAVLQSGRPYDPAMHQQGTLDFQYGI